jgi:ribosome-associated toxin RatA of RatAB toxin-antitoxin module
MKLGRIIHRFSTLKYKLSRRASVNPDIFYQTVAQTDKYSTFLPWCTHSSITEFGYNFNETRLDVKFGLYDVSYVSHVTFSEP